MAEDPAMDANGAEGFEAVSRSETLPDSHAASPEPLIADAQPGSAAPDRDNSEDPAPAGPSAEGPLADGAPDLGAASREGDDPACSPEGTDSPSPEAGEPPPGVDPEMWSMYNDVAIPPGDPIPSSPVISEITPADDDDLQSPQDSPLSTSVPVQVLVTNPMQVEEVTLGVKSQFTTFCVKSATRLQSYPFKERTVWRRFRDFEALHKVLHIRHRGYFIPPLPGKNFIQAKMAKAAFLQMRQGELNRFLRGLVAHPFLYNTEELKMFLGTPQELSSSHEWQETLRQANALQLGFESSQEDSTPPSTGAELWGRVRRMGTSIKKEVIKSRRTMPEDERQLRQVSIKIRQMESLLTWTCQQARKLVLAMEGVFDAHLDMGRALVTFARFEERIGAQCGQYTQTGRQSATRAADLQKAGYATLKVHQICRQYVNLTAGSMAPLHEQLGLIPAALGGLEDRENAMDAIHQTEDALERKRLRLDDLTRESAKKLGGLESFSKKSAELGSGITSLVLDMQRLTAEYATVKERNRTELIRSRESRHAALIGMATNVAKIQVELNESAAVAWMALAEQMEKAMASE